MISVKVFSNDIAGAIKYLKKKKAQEGDAHEAKLRRIAKPSERRKAKSRLALKRKKMSLKREFERGNYANGKRI